MIIINKFSSRHSFENIFHVKLTLSVEGNYSKNSNHGYLCTNLHIPQWVMLALQLDDTNII